MTPPSDGAAAGYYRRTDCRLCHQPGLDQVVRLTPTPPANALVPAEAVGVPVRAYPLDVYMCRSCGHAQLLDIVSGQELFSDYRYLTGASPALVRHSHRYAAQVLAFTGLRPGARVLEIGSNDGTQLAAFAARGLAVLGADPAARPVAAARERGIPSLLGFFGPAMRPALWSSGAPFDLIVANNVMAHIDDLDAVAALVGEVLADQGTFVLEVGYLGDIIADTLFDVIYHEHVSYHAVTPLAAFLARHGLRAVHVEHTPMQGGSIRVYARKAGAGPAGPAVEAFLAAERDRGLTQPRAFEAFAGRVGQLRQTVRDRVHAIAAGGARVWGYGAAAKATTLLYHFGLGDVIEAIADDNPAKQGLYTPGHCIPVVHPDQLYQRRPTDLLVFAWNYIDSIRQQHARYLGQGGRFLVPLPSFHTVTAPVPHRG